MRGSSCIIDAHIIDAHTPYAKYHVKRSIPGRRGLRYAVLMLCARNGQIELRPERASRQRPELTTVGFND